MARDAPFEDDDDAAWRNRTAEYRAAVDRACAMQDVPPDAIRAIKQEMMLGRAKSEPTPFVKAAVNTRTAIEDLDQFVRANKREYTAPPVVTPRVGRGAGGAAAASSSLGAAGGGLSSADRDRIEAEVGAVVKTCAAQIEQLKGSVVAAQREQQAARRRMMAGGGGGGGAMARRLGPKDGPATAVNEETIAHLHGVVLALADRLGEVSAAFDRCRAARHSAAAAAAAAYGGGGGGGGGGFGMGGAAAAAGGAGGAAGGRPPSARAAEAAQRYSNLAAAQAAAQAWDGSNDGASGGGGGAGADGAGVAKTEAALQRQQQQQQQQQQLLESESAALIAQLTSRRTQVRDVERSMREVAQLGSMLSTAVQGQQRQIELLYDEAVAATRSLRLGNAELRKTVRVNRSTRSYVLALLLTASALLLLFDWLA